VSQCATGFFDALKEIVGVEIIKITVTRETYHIEFRYRNSHYSLVAEPNNPVSAALWKEGCKHPFEIQLPKMRAVYVFENTLDMQKAIEAHLHQASNIEESETQTAEDACSEVSETQTAEDACSEVPDTQIAEESCTKLPPKQKKRMNAFTRLTSIAKPRCSWGTSAKKQENTCETEQPVKQQVEQFTERLEQVTSPNIFSMESILIKKHDVDIAELQKRLTRLEEDFSDFKITVRTL
jgi:hypothetical protein